MRKPVSDRFDTSWIVQPQKKVRFLISRFRKKSDTCSTCVPKTKARLHRLCFHICKKAVFRIARLRFNCLSVEQLVFFNPVYDKINIRMCNKTSPTIYRFCCALLVGSPDMSETGRMPRLI